MYIETRLLALEKAGDVSNIFFNYRFNLFHSVLFLKSGELEHIYSSESRVNVVRQPALGYRMRLVEREALHLTSFRRVLTSARPSHFLQCF